MQGKELLNKYNKKFILSVYSGTLAIEGVLKCLKLPNEKVLITNVVCYSILNSILNANMIPIIAIPKNGITLSKDEIIDIVKKENIKVFIAVHQYGYEQEIIKIKDLIIIEDISQAWNIELYNSYVGQYSDYIITSLGKSKPLNNGIGGLILSDMNFIDKFDIKERACRNSYDNLLGFYYPLEINYKKLVRKADKKVMIQRKNAKYFDNILEPYKFIRRIKTSGFPSYHRYVITVADEEYDNVLKILDMCGINYQKEYKNKLDCINLTISNNIKVLGKSINKKTLLLKTNNKYLNIRKFKLEMRKYYGS